MRPARQLGGRVICTVAAGRHAELWEVAAPSVHRYAVRHGYDVVVRQHAPGLGGRPVAWAKLPLVLELLERHELVVWLDADTMVVRHERDIADDARSGHAVHVVTHHIRGALVPNSGVMVVRRSDRSEGLLRTMWHRSRFIHHPWWENAALIDVLGGDADRGLVGRAQERRLRRVVGSLPHEWNSVVPDPHPRPSIVHFAGEPMDDRLCAMRALADRMSAAPAPSSAKWPDGRPFR